tara:strand:+ start:781 stop:1014 length:234 start_codon:yes stop_codon:yes gene_type:complete
MAKSRPANVIVTLREVRGDSSKLIRKFLKKVKKIRIEQECRDRRFFEKPSTKRRKAKLRKKEVRRKAEAQRREKLNT